MEEEGEEEKRGEKIKKSIARKEEDDIIARVDELLAFLL